MLRSVRFVEVTLAGPSSVAGFYGETLGLPLEEGAIRVGETTLRFDPAEGEPFYHYALLVPGDRFDAALTWASERVELLGGVFDFDNWDARALYFHDPAGNIVELIAHHGLEENGRSGAFAGEELVGFSELGLVGDPRFLLGRLEPMGLEFWDGNIAEPDGLAFVGEQGRTLILARPGRGWLPTGRPAEWHPIEVALIGGPVHLRF